MSALSSLKVSAPSGYAGNFPRFGQPKEVAYFSRDASRRVTYDRSALRAYRPAKLPATLDEGFESFVPRTPTDPADPAPLVDVLGALAHKSVPLSGTAVVSYRNNLNKIFATPYQPSDEWEVGVERRADGVVLLLVRDTAS